MEDFSLVSMLPLDTNEEDSITDIIYHCDQIIQYGENLESDEQSYLRAEAKLRGDAYGEEANGEDED